MQREIDETGEKNKPEKNALKLEKNAARHSDIDREASNLRSRDLSADTRAKLKAEDPRLADGDAILNDNSGKLAENYARITIENEGLPQGHERIKFDRVVDPKPDGHNQGIDLVGVERDGTPTMIEVKKRKGADTFGNEPVSWNELEPETRAQVAELREQSEILPIDRQHKQEWRAAVEAELKSRNSANYRPEDFDRNESLLQMGDIWARDRWLKTIKDPESVEKLRQAGVDERYLDMNRMKEAGAPEWKDILNRRAYVFVSHERDVASPSAMENALFMRRVDVVGMTVGRL